MFEAGALKAAEAVVQRRVYVVDDDAGVRMSLVFMLEDSGYLPWPFANGLDLLGALPDLEPGCLLLDVRMPVIDGLQIMAALDRAGCHWPVIVMTGHGDIPTAVQAMKMNAIEFIEKPVSEPMLNAVMERGFAKLDADERKRRAGQSARDLLETLSARERSVLTQLIQGRQNKAVAFDLGLSVRTVEMHRANLFAKLGVRTLQEASALAARAEPSAA